MRKLPFPPPTSKVKPRYHRVNRGSEFFRIYDPSPPYSPGPLTFRHNGPRLRFDHHPRLRGKAADHPRRAIWYGAFAFAACVAEVFGDDREIRLNPYMVARVRVLRHLKLLDLDDGAMSNGTFAALASSRNRRLTQAWSSYFYEANAYGRVDGLYYRSAHNSGPCVALYERSADALTLLDALNLEDPVFRFEIAVAQRRYGMSLFEIREMRQS